MKTKFKTKIKTTKKPSLRRGLASTKIKRSLTKRGSYGGSKEQWQTIRSKVLARDKCCKKCGATTNLQVHHITPISRGGTDSLLNLMTLCYVCHCKQPNHQHLKR